MDWGDLYSQKPGGSFSSPFLMNRRRIRVAHAGHLISIFIRERQIDKVTKCQRSRFWKRILEGWGREVERGRRGERANLEDIFRSLNGRYTLAIRVRVNLG